MVDGDDFDGCYNCWLHKQVVAFLIKTIAFFERLLLALFEVNKSNHMVESEQEHELE